MLLVITLGVAATALGVAQQPPFQTFRTGVDVVHVDVSGLDRNRVPVQGLTAGATTRRRVRFSVLPRLPDVPRAPDTPY